MGTYVDIYFLFSTIFIIFFVYLRKVYIIELYIMKKIYNITISVLAIFLFQISAFSQTKPLIDLVETPSGSYYMGREDKGENYDEIPAYKVNVSKTFRMGGVEVANVQYEKFRSEHKKLHGKDNVSVGDDDAVVNVSYQDAVDFSRDNKEVSFTDYPQRTRKED